MLHDLMQEPYPCHSGNVCSDNGERRIRLFEMRRRDVDTWFVHHAPGRNRPFPTQITTVIIQFPGERPHRVFLAELPIQRVHQDFEHQVVERAGRILFPPVEHLRNVACEEIDSPGIPHEGVTG